jgi:hypothetical protein
MMRALLPTEKPEAPLDPAVIKLIDALARAQAKGDDERERTAQPPAPSR